MDYRIIYRNTATKECFVFTEEDRGSEHFYLFPQPKGLTEGEYEYFVVSAAGELHLDSNDPRLSTLDGERVVVYDCGVAQVGTIARSTEEYQAEKEYIQYGAETE